jgi:hypothetical protein
VKPEVASAFGLVAHALGAFASASINRYSDFDTENTEEYTLGVNGRLDIERGSNIAGSVQYQAAHRTAHRADLAGRRPRQAG